MPDFLTATWHGFLFALLLAGWVILIVVAVVIVVALLRVAYNLVRYGHGAGPKAPAPPTDLVRRPVGRILDTELRDDGVYARLQLDPDVAGLPGVETVSINLDGLPGVRFHGTRPPAILDEDPHPRGVYLQNTKGVPFLTCAALAPAHDGLCIRPHGHHPSQGHDYSRTALADLLAAGEVVIP